MRGDVVEIKKTSIFRTLDTGLLLSLLVMAAALIYMLYQFAPATDRASVMLPYAIPFGTTAVILGGVALFFMSSLEKLRSRYITLIVALLSGLLEIAVGILGIAIFANLGIGISIIGIGVCLLGLDFVAFLSRKEGLPS